jgi:hypothetical protein
MLAEPSASDSLVLVHFSVVSDFKWPFFEADLPN